MSIAKLWPLIKEVPELNIYFPDLRDNELPERRYAWAIISTIKPDVVKSLLSEARTRRSINNIEKIESMIKVSKEFYEAISAIVCQKRKSYNKYFPYYFIAHTGKAAYLLRKRAKLGKKRADPKKYPANYSLVKSQARRGNEEAKESMQTSSRYYNTIEMEPEEPDPKPKTLKRSTSQSFDSDSMFRFLKSSQK